MSVVTSQRSSAQTVETLKHIHNDESFNAFYDSVLEKKKIFTEVNIPLLGRQRQVPPRYAIGASSSEYPATLRDHYRKVYLEALDLLTKFSNISIHGVFASRFLREGN